ncbi:YcnI family copper-binding membrane protein [Virgibacillus dakarensis]|uniref:YcnI family copper-binding membrane protein n=1 Tax=Virgibacillus dakarensis TaxID=1917889 RepID=UPI001F28C317|nr:YcnI family protein [Virgibacillus dakarensis]
MIKRTKWFIPLFAVLFLFVMAPIAEAHVTVHPSESSTNDYEKYTVRVPVEKDTNTTEVKLEVPEGINLVSVLPMPDWDYKLEKDDNDVITSVTWLTKDKGIGPNEFIEFSFIGANPGEPGEFSWKAYQTYDDGSVVDWVGPADADEPASVTKVVEGDGAAPHGDNQIADPSNTTEEKAADDNATSGTANNWLSISLATVAILLAIISLFRKRA